jgi:hypothetical protein
VQYFRNRARQAAKAVIVGGALLVATAGVAQASNHLDTPTTIGNPQANIGDLFAWTSPNGRQLNLVMDIVGRSFSDRLQYVFHIDSGKQFGQTTATTTIVCRFPAANIAECRVGDVDVARGDATNPAGLAGRRHRFQVFAGLRDDPFFNNVKGSRDAYNVAIAALKNGAVTDAAGCPKFDEATSHAILDHWRHTSGGPATNLLAKWTTSAIVISIDLDAVNKGGDQLAVWGATATSEKQLDRAGRPMMKNSLLGLFSADDVADGLKEKYNLATPATSSEFIPEIQRALGIYDGFDGKCGNGLMANDSDDIDVRYGPLAIVLADDRLWVNSASTTCTQLFAVELANLAGRRDLRQDCGGRTPNYSAANIYRSLLVAGTTSGIDDGLTRDERKHSDSVFPFLAAPDPGPAANP